MRKQSQNLIEESSDVETVPDPEQAARDAVREYDPQTDPRLWKAMSEMWRSVATEFCEVAAGYQSDGKPHEIAGRLSRELNDRIAQEQHSFSEFREQFRKTANEWVARQKSNAISTDMAAQLDELQRERESASARAAELDRRNREHQAAELERQAAALRSGPQSRTTSFLAR